MPDQGTDIKTNETSGTQTTITMQPANIEFEIKKIKKVTDQLKQLVEKSGITGITIITSVIIIMLLLTLFIWIFHKIGLKDETCNKFSTNSTSASNVSYFQNNTTIKSDAIPYFDNSYSILINYFVKSSYNSCCGGEYKNNFVSICALEKCIKDGCRFLDFEIYSYNNIPIVASSTANNNYIKETYNALLLDEVLKTINDLAFTPVIDNKNKGTACHNDPLILNFRVMSTNITMLQEMGKLFEKYIPLTGNKFLFNKDDAVLNMKMKDLFQKVIIICDFNPNSNILLNDKLTILKNYVNLKGKGTKCNTFRYNNTTTIDDTQRRFTIVLPNLDNSTQNFNSISSFTTGCQAICMKHQTDENSDSNLKFYNAKFNSNYGDKNNFSWILKETHLINVAPPSFDTPEGITLGATPPVGV
jgi:hypothetical protein